MFDHATSITSPVIRLCSQMIRTNIKTMVQSYVDVVCLYKLVKLKINLRFKNDKGNKVLSFCGGAGGKKTYDIVVFSR